MIDFSLSRRRDKLLPDSMSSGGKTVLIDPDFRCVLKCLRVLGDPDIEISDKLYLLMTWFFKGEYVENAVELFLEFMGNGSEEEAGDERLMDFEQDADAIYASFYGQYGIDLIDIPFLHWRKFLALLGGLNEDSPLRQRMSLRGMDTSGLKGKDLQKVMKAKSRIQIVEKIGREEMALRAELEKAAANGEDTTEILKRLEEYDLRR